ncbi:MAG: neutral/alkaline non-lysosomal ceramidase N-terminal domain-containing protein, partial [Bacteroidota bacterium]
MFIALLDNKPTPKNQVDLNIPASQSSYKIGTGIASVTDPATGQGMQGMADIRQKTSGVKMKLYARAFIVEDVRTQKRVILMNADLWSMTKVVKREVIKRLQAKYGELYTHDNTWLSGTHNHSGPGGYSEYFLYNHSIGGFDTHNFATIVAGIVKAIDNAHQNLDYGKIYYGSTTLEDCGRNRSIEAYLANPFRERKRYERETDETLFLLKFVQLDGTQEKEVGMLSWFAIHPTACGQFGTQINGDLKGYASFLVEQNRGTHYEKQATFVGAFANSNGGDVSGNVEFGRIPNGHNDHLHMIKHGQAQAEAALKLLDGPLNLVEGEIDFRHQFWDLSKRTGSPGVLGASMFAGSSEDSVPWPPSGLREGITTNNAT